MRLYVHLLTYNFPLSLLFCFLLLSPLLSPAQKKADSPDFLTLSGQANAARDAEHLDDAVALYKKALLLQPGWVEGWWSLGTVEYDRSNYAKAAEAFRHLVSLAPKDGTARAMLGLCQFELGQDADALRNIRAGRLLGLSDDQQLRHVTIYHEGVLLLRTSKFKLAQETLGSLCKQNVTTDQLFEGMGLAVMRIMPKDAPPEQSPGATVVRKAGSAACMAVQRKFDEAVATDKALLADYPNYPGLHYATGLTYVEADNVESAVNEFKLELSRDPANIPAKLEIATILYKVDSKTAIQYANDVVRSRQNLPFPHYLLGLLYLDVGEAPKAIPELELAAKAFPNDAKVFFALSTAYARTGNKEKAAQARARFEKLNKQSDSNSKATY